MWTQHQCSSVWQFHDLEQSSAPVACTGSVLGWRRHSSHAGQRLLSCSHLGLQTQLSWNNTVLPSIQTSLFSVLPSHSFFYGFSPSESCHMYTNENIPNFNVIYQIVLPVLLRFFFPIVTKLPIFMELLSFICLRHVGMIFYKQLSPL